MKPLERMTHMTEFVPLFPRQPVPPLHVNLVGAGLFDLRGERPQHFTLVVFYRGLHCPLCKTQLRELESKLDQFNKRRPPRLPPPSHPKQPPLNPTTPHASS